METPVCARVLHPLRGVICDYVPVEGCSSRSGGHTSHTTSTRSRHTLCNLSCQGHPLTVPRARAAYGDSMQKYARSRRKLAKAGRPSENMHAARRRDGCENMQTVTNTTRDNRVPIPILFCSPPVASLIASFQCAKTCVSYKGFRQRVLVGRVSCYGACLRKCASPTPAPRQNRPNAKICTGDYPGADCENMHSAKIILSPYGQQSYATPDWARGHNGHGTIVTSKRK
eukprot:scaffold31714_cov38-Phaeocystis_antarctica.AAC.2